MIIVPINIKGTSPHVAQADLEVHRDMFMAVELRTPAEIERFLNLVSADVFGEFIEASDLDYAKRKGVPLAFKVSKNNTIDIISAAADLKNWLVNEKIEVTCFTCYTGLEQSDTENYKKFVERSGMTKPCQKFVTENF